MVGCVQGLIGSLKTAAAPALKRCTTAQISIGCCTNTIQCGTLGAGISCSPASNPDPFDPEACQDLHMLTDSSLEFVYNGERGVPLVWVIDTQCVYDIALSVEHAAIFTEADEVVDISEDYPEHEGVTVRFIKDGQVLEELQTSEYFGSVLLSSPQVLSLLDYPYGMYVMSPNALFVNGEFVILETDMDGLEPYHREHGA